MASRPSFVARSSRLSFAISLAESQEANRPANAEQFQEIEEIRRYEVKLWHAFCYIPDLRIELIERYVDNIFDRISQR